MKIQSIAQKDVYEFEPSDTHIKVIKSDGKIWYIPMRDIYNIEHALSIESRMRSLEGELEALTIKE